MTIKAWDYIKEFEVEKQEILQAIEDVLTSGWLILGEKVAKFEEDFSAWCGVKYGVGVNSATDAIFLALKALDIGIGDEVITVSNTAVPTVSAITATGAKAIFVDIESDTYLMDPSKIEAVITKKTKCIIPVHLYGQCVNMNFVNTIADKYNLFVLEDCAQSHGAEFEGKRAGSMSDVSAFSFYPTKILGGYGDGGIILSNNKQTINRLKRLRYYGMEKTYYSIEQGYNSRLDELHASILLSKMKHIDEYIHCRRQLANTYHEHLTNSPLILPKEAQGRKHTYYMYVVRHNKRDKVIEELRKRKIFVNISYPWPIHTMSGFSQLGYKKGDLPITEKLAQEIFSLPLYPSFGREDQMQVIIELSNILQSI